MKAGAVAIVCFGVCVASLIVWWTWSRPADRITEDSYRQIMSGMSQAQVEKILGGPPGDYGPGVGHACQRNGGSLASVILTDPSAQRWLGKDMAIVLQFDSKGGVTGMSYQSVYRPYHSVAEMLGQMVGVVEKRKHPEGTMERLFEDIREQIR